MLHLLLYCIFCPRPGAVSGEVFWPGRSGFPYFPMR